MGLFNLSSSLSGIAAAATQLSVSADNVARRNVPSAERNRVINAETATGGVATTIQNVPLAPGESTGEAEFYDTSNIDYAEEFVGQIIAKTAFQANVAAANAQLGLMDKLVDIRI